MTKLERNWENVSKESKDLIRHLLTYNSSERLSAEEALKSPWIVENTKIDSKRKEKVIVSALKNISNFKVN